MDPCSPVTVCVGQGKPEKGGECFEGRLVEDCLAGSGVDQSLTGRAGFHGTQPGLPLAWICSVGTQVGFVGSGGSLGNLLAAE